MCVQFPQLLSETQVSGNHKLKSQAFLKWYLILDVYSSFFPVTIHQWSRRDLQGSKLHYGISFVDQDPNLPSNKNLST